MKNFVRRALAVCLALILTSTAALAAVSATPNQKLAFRTGPSTSYEELFTLPASTALTAYEYEEGSGVTWVLVEFTYKGEVYRAYTGLKRMTVNGSIPWANHQYQSVACTSAATVYAAPSAAAAVRDSLGYMEQVALLRIDGTYAYIEYTADSGKLTRGWVQSWALNINSNVSSGGSLIFTPSIATGDVSVAMYVDLAAPMYNEPEYGPTAVRVIPQYATVQCYGYLFNGFSIVEYNGYVGYIPSHFLTSYE